MHVCIYYVGVSVFVRACDACCGIYVHILEVVGVVETVIGSVA